MTTWDERMTPRPRPESRLELLEVCWRFVGVSQRVVTCGIYGVQTGVEVRVGYSAEDILRTQLTPDIVTARARRRVAPGARRQGVHGDPHDDGPIDAADLAGDVRPFRRARRHLPTQDAALRPQAGPYWSSAGPSATPISGARP